MTMTNDSVHSNLRFPVYVSTNKTTFYVVFVISTQILPIFILFFLGVFVFCLRFILIEIILSLSLSFLYNFGFPITVRFILFVVFLYSYSYSLQRFHCILRVSILLLIFFITIFLIRCLILFYNLQKKRENLKLNSVII